MRVEPLQISDLLRGFERLFKAFCTLILSRLCKRSWSLKKCCCNLGESWTIPEVAANGEVGEGKCPLEQQRPSAALVGPSAAPTRIS